MVRGNFVCRATSPSRSSLPIAAQLSTSLSSTMLSSTAMPAVALIGLPPKVEMFPPFHESAMGVVASVALSGKPLAMPLAIVMMSGSTPAWCSMPHILPPVRPNPVCTSSQMNTPPYLRTMSTAVLKYPSGASMKPPTPWIGSARNQRFRRRSSSGSALRCPSRT